jgi:hypothetical protein
MDASIDIDDLWTTLPKMGEAVLQTKQCFAQPN